MTTINFLSSVDVISGGDLFPLWSTFSSDTRKVPVSQIGNYFSQNYTFRDSKTNSYFVPTENQVINIVTNGGGAWVVIDGLQNLSTIGITFPSINALKTGEEIIINIGNISISNIILDANGSNVINFPSSFGVFDFVKYRYNQISNTWYNQFQEELI